MTKTEDANRKYIVRRMASALANLEPVKGRYGCLDYAINDVMAALAVANLEPAEISE